MSTQRVKPIDAKDIKRNMMVRAVHSYGNATATIEGPVRSVGNASSILIGTDAEDFFTVAAEGTEFFEIINMPEMAGSVVLLKVGEIKLALTLSAMGTWLTYGGDIWSVDEVLAQLDRVLWDAAS